MKLSIIIVSYNEKKYLPAAIESCLKQKSDFDIEIIVGDDGSDDGSIEIINDYREKYKECIKYFVMDRTNAVNVIPSIRVSNVLKQAFKLAEGEYLMVMSGDDLLINETKIMNQVKFLEKHNQYASCYTDYKKFWGDGREINCIMRSTISRYSFWSSQYMHISCFVFRRSALNHLLNRFCDDTGLIFSIFCAGKSKHIPLMGFGYRQRSESIMHETDKIELSILELALFQDILNYNGYKNSSLSRFCKPLQYLFALRESLSDKKYSKYLSSCSQYKYNLLEKLNCYDSLPEKEKKDLIRLVRKSIFYKNFFGIIRKVDVGINMILRN